MEHLVRIATGYNFNQIAILDITSKGETVWGLFDVQGTYTPEGGSRRARRPLKFEIAIRWRVRNDKIVEHQAFFDTAELISQQEGEPMRQDLQRPAL